MKEEALFNAWHSNVLIIGTQGNPDFAISVQEIAIFHVAIDQQAGCATAGPAHVARLQDEAQGRR